MASGRGAGRVADEESLATQSEVRVFISYAHDDPAHEERVRGFWHFLRANGVDARLDLPGSEERRDWVQWMTQQVRDADRILVVASPKYKVRAEGDAEPEQGRGVQWEASLIRQRFYADQPAGLRLVLPVVLPDCSAADIPLWLAPAAATYYTVSEYTVQGAEQLLRSLTGQPSETMVPLGTKPLLPPRQPPTFPSAPSAVSGQPRLPNTDWQTWNTQELVFTEARALGRESEIAQLNEAWALSQTHVLWLIAPSGVGKTALVNEWLDTFSDPTLERVFAWSFNNRSANEAALIGSEFLHAALEWVGDPTPDRGSGWIRGERLAGLLRKKPTLLVLDGLESLMYGDDVGPSAIADPAVYALLMDLAQDNNGLCVVTARRSVSKLADPENVRVLDLDDISSKAGRDILRAEGIKLKGAHLEDIASAFGPNALALQLLAAFLVAHPDIDAMKAIVPSAPDKRSERHARWVLDAWICVGDLNAAELQLLRLLYIFDRPIKPIELARIVDSKTTGLTDQLPAITDAAWHQLTDRLRSRRLILPSRPHSRATLDDSRETLDAHPLVRAYFGEFFDQRRDLYEAAHKTLADELLEALGSPPSHEDTTVRSVLAAYEVVHHLLAAGDFEQAMDIHWKYVRCGRRHFQHRDYSLLSTDLSMWSEFFHIRWSELRPELGNFGLYRPYIFAEAAWNLFALGSPKEAVEAAGVAFRESVSYKQWLEAAGIAEHLSEYFLSLGQVKESDNFATEALRHSSNPERNEWLGPWPEPAHRQVQARVMAARVALYKYDLAECSKLMQEAGEIHRQLHGNSAVRGYGTYTHVDMLLERELVPEAIERAEQTLLLPESVDSDDRAEVTVGIERIALGRAYAHARDFGRALFHLDDGVASLRQVGREDVVALSYLERARVKRLMGQVAESEHDLRYALRIAYRAGLEPLLAMAKLEMAELLVVQNRQSESVIELQQARERGRRIQYEYVLRWCERFASRVKERRDRGTAG
jgi:tetratricopeptide (TPR) repeat protein